MYKLLKLKTRLIYRQMDKVIHKGAPLLERKPTVLNYVIRLWAGHGDFLGVYTQT